MKLSKKNFIFTGFLLFSMFFGAGNLIFPPYSGNQAGFDYLFAIFGILITAVGFPVLGVAAVAKTDGLDNLANRVHPVFATLFSLLIYLSIGPLIAIPRTSTVPFEMAFLPYLPQNISPKIALLAFSFLFFAVSYWLSLNPSKLVDRMGKILTPVLILLIVFLFIMTETGKKSIVSPVGAYSEHAFLQGFVEGYQTLDVAAALVFGSVITVIMRDFGIEDNKVVVLSTIQTGILAGVILGIIYLMLGRVGAISSGFLTQGENGAQILTYMIVSSTGTIGISIVAVIFLLACLSTCVGLVTSCSDYFSSLAPKVGYKNFVRIITLFSFIVANQGLDRILTFSVPILTILYPACMVLITLTFLDSFFFGKQIVYRMTVFLTLILSILDVLESFLPLELPLLQNLPMAHSGLGWFTPVFVVFLVTSILSRSAKKAT